MLFNDMNIGMWYEKYEVSTPDVQLVMFLVNILSSIDPDIVVGALIQLSYPAKLNAFVTKSFLSLKPPITMIFSILGDVEHISIMLFGMFVKLSHVAVQWRYTVKSAVACCGNAILTIS